MPAVVPLVIAGVQAGSSMYAAHKQKKAADAQLAAQQPLVDKTMGIGDESAGMGRQLFNTGMQTLQQPLDYYGRLLKGNRSDLMEATAPERGQISDVYRGAQRGLERTGAQGAQRDVAAADLNRERAGKLASTVMGVRPGAASALGSLAQFAIGNGQQGVAGAGSLYSSLLGGMNSMAQQKLNERKYNDSQSAEMWKNIGALSIKSYDAWKNRSKGAGGGGGSLYGNVNGYSN